MDNFASASMQRLLLRAMAAAGLAAPPQPMPPMPVGAHVPLALKQQLVARIVQAGGLALLLRLARQVQHIEGEPLHRALAAAADPHDFSARWQRLERYVHASHRVRVGARGPNWLLLEHVAREASGAPPLAAESVAVLGVWIGALEVAGTRGLRVEIDGWPAHPEPASPWPFQAQGRLPAWRLVWEAAGASTVSAASSASPAPVAPPASPAPGAGQRRLGGVAGRSPPAARLAEPLPWAEPAAAVARWLAQDPAGGARLATAAAAFGQAPRSLQRRLASAGIGFAELAGEVRLRLAAAWLVHSGHGLADIGFLCGYADQPHFTREFTRRAGVSPARYRQAAQGQGGETGPGCVGLPGRVP